MTDSVKPEERIRTLIIPCIRPLAVSFDMKRYPPLGPQRGLLELTEDDAESFEPSEEVLISARFEMLGPAAIIVESIGFVPHVSHSSPANFCRPEVDATTCPALDGCQRTADLLVLSRQDFG